jgi:hypothetical protein
MAISPSNMSRIRAIANAPTSIHVHQETGDFRRSEIRSPANAVRRATARAAQHRAAGPELRRTIRLKSTGHASDVLFTIGTAQQIGCRSLAVVIIPRHASPKALPTYTFIAVVGVVCANKAENGANQEVPLIGRCEKIANG